MNVLKEKTHSLSKEFNSNFNLDKDTFDELLHALRHQGDETLIRVIFETQYAAAKALLCGKYKASADNAHDVVMDVLLDFRTRLLEGRLKYNSLSSLFKTSAWQNYIHLSRTTRRWVFIPPENTQQYFDEPDTTSEWFENRLHEELCLQQLEQVFKAAFNELCKYCRKILNLYYSEGKTATEVARILPIHHCECGAKSARSTTVSKDRSGAVKAFANKLKEKLKLNIEKRLQYG